jgi:hypothetical protein
MKIKYFRLVPFLEVKITWFLLDFVSCLPFSYLTYLQDDAAVVDGSGGEPTRFKPPMGGQVPFAFSYINRFVRGFCMGAQGA